MLIQNPSVEIFPPASISSFSALWDLPVSSSGFDDVLSTHWKGLYFINLPSGLMNCFTLQFINILMVIQVLLEHKGEKKPANIQECSFCKMEINVCVCVTPGNSVGPSQCAIPLKSGCNMLHNAHSRRNYHHFQCHLVVASAEQDHLTSLHCRIFYLVR